MSDKTILLIEDNPKDEALTLRALKKQNIGNDVIVARDGAEALDYLFSPSDEKGPIRRSLPRFILLDLKLPKVNGFEVLRRIRADERTMFLPIVILTSSKEEQDVVQGYSLGANSFVCKPIDSVQFTDAVRQLGVYWLLVNEPPPPTGGL